MTVAVTAFIGWWAELPTLSSWGSGWVNMRPITALCLAVAGLALMHPGRNSRFAFAVGLAVIAVAVFDFGMNRWFGPPVTAPGPDAGSFRWGSGMPLGFALAGGSLALSRFERHHFVAITLSGIAGAIAVFALLGYLAGIDMAYGSVRPPALPTPVGLLCVVSGIILRIGTVPALRKSRPLWQLLVVLGCAIIAPLLLLAVYAGFRITDAQFDHTRKELMHVARTLSAQVDREIIGEIERLQILAASSSLRQGDFGEFQRKAEASLALRQSGKIMLVDRNMRQLANTRVPFGTPLEKAAIPESVERALVTGKPQVTGLFMDPVVKQFIFGIVVPVEIGGQSPYALIRSPDPHGLERLLAANELPAGWYAVISDAAHRIIASAQPQDRLIGTALPQAQWPRAGPGGVFEFADPEGRASLEAYALSDLTGWETAAWAPKALVEAPVRALWWMIGLTILLALPVVVALASWLGRIIAGSVGHAARTAIASGPGGPPYSNGTPVAEVNMLIAELREAATRRQATEDLLRSSEARFRAMFEVSSVGKIETECETGRFLRANAAMCKFVGYSEAELLATTVWDITHPDDRERDREPIRRLLTGESSVFDVEKRYIRKDGKAVWARVTVNLIRDECGRPLHSMAVILDINARKQAEQDLQASKDRLQFALDAAQLGWWQYDPRRRVISWDTRFKEILGVAKDEAPIEELMELVHPNDTEKVWAAIDASLDPTSPRPSVVEHRVRRKDSEFRWAEAHWLAYFEGPEGERRAVRVVGTIQDITERKEREEKEHLLMREINHRAKNMLSVVHAIANQTMTKNPKDFIERFSERIQALSANQDLLVRNEWSGVEIEDLVHAQLAHFAGLIGSRIAVHGPRLRLKEASEQAIGLALHELATNAGKYGALSTDAGRVDICWEFDGDNFAMSWTERDGPPASPPKRRGFGTVVMEAMVERSVDGTVDLDYAPSGLTWRLTCPAANALEPTEARAKFAGTGKAYSLQDRPRRTNDNRNSSALSESPRSRA